LEKNEENFISLSFSFNLYFPVFRKDANRDTGEISSTNGGGKYHGGADERLLVFYRI
jgi:hypothetical protein